MVSGWLFDAYHINDKMVSWIKNENSIQRIEDEWTSSIYVATDDIKDLERLEKDSRITDYIKDATYVEKFEKVSDQAKSKVLQLRMKNNSDMLRLAKIIESSHEFGRYRLYNVDVSPAQNYFYEHDIFPFGKCRRDKKWIIDDDIRSTDYILPVFKISYLSVETRKQGKVPKFTDIIDSITIDNLTIKSDDETELLLDLVKTIQDVDPDFVITDAGDTFDFPYLIHRAQHNNISERLVLGREKIPLKKPKSEGTSYFSYGRIYFKPSAIKLLGRIHIDRASCFIWNSIDDLQGLYEIARVCRMPMQTASRASIGKCMSSLQFYNATKRGLLIPWKPIMAEAFKTRNELLIGDRGGLIFEPEIGVFENVVELDFTSLYGAIMEQKNISAETILCSCCFDSTNRVPELNYNICRRRGIVPQSLEILLEKRKKYGMLLQNLDDKEKSRIYDARKTALKWILVTSFGYLGFNNAKFGRIDAHMAVCAFARQLLKEAAHIAEDYGYRVLHGIVDSLWLHKEDTTRYECGRLKDKIQKETGFDLSLDVYKWIVFLPSKEREFVPVANRYFGVFENGKIKVRGIELRRHDTPLFFKKCQLDILKLLANANTSEEIRKLLPDVEKIYKKYRVLLLEQKIPPEELSFTIRASKNIEEYSTNSIQADAMLQMKEEGESIRAGQKLQYVITDYKRKRKRSIPLKMVNNTKYDAKRYTKLLTECCNTLTKPFGTEISP